MISTSASLTLFLTSRLLFLINAEPTCPEVIKKTAKLTERQCLGTCAQMIDTFTCIKGADIGRHWIPIRKNDVKVIQTKASFEDCQTQCISMEGLVVKSLYYHPSDERCASSKKAPGDVALEDVPNGIEIIDKLQLCARDCQEMITSTTTASAVAKTVKTTSKPKAKPQLAHVSQLAHISAVSDPCRTVNCGNGTCFNGTCDYCRPNKCDEGTCTSKQSIHSERKFNFTCKCKNGYGGPYCKLVDNPCQSNPCKNGGECKVKIKPGPNEWICKCKGRPRIGQYKDCSEEKTSKYPIPEATMKAAVAIPFFVFLLACVAFGVYECWSNGELPTIPLASASQSPTVQSIEFGALSRDRCDDSTKHENAVRDSKELSNRVRKLTKSGDIKRKRQKIVMSQNKTGTKKISRSMDSLCYEKDKDIKANPIVVIESCGNMKTAPFESGIASNMSQHQPLGLLDSSTIWLSPTHSEASSKYYTPHETESNKSRSSLRTVYLNKTSL